MKKYPQIEITVYETSHHHKSEIKSSIKWLQAMLPLIMRTQVMITDDLFIAPLGQAVSLCLS